MLEQVLRRTASTATTTSSAAAATTSACKSLKGTDSCEKPTGSQALPIGLGIAIPLAFAIIVLFFLHRRHVRRLKREDVLVAGIDLNQEDFDVTPPRVSGRRGAEKGFPLSASDYLVPMSNAFIKDDQLQGPYHVVPQEVSRYAIHANSSYPALPRAPQSAQTRGPNFHQRDSPYDLRGQFRDNSSVTPSRLSTMTSASVEAAVNRIRPAFVKRPTRNGLPEESYEMNNISKPQAALIHTPSSDRSYSDPIVDAVYHFNDAPQNNSESDLSSSPPGASLSLPSSSLAASPSPSPSSSPTPESKHAPKRSASLSKLSRPLSSAPPMPEMESVKVDDRTSYYTESEFGVEHDELVQPSQYSAPGAPETPDLQREKSFSSPADAGERALKIRSFYKDYFEQPASNLDRQMSVQSRDDSEIMYRNAGQLRVNGMPSSATVPALPSLAPLQTSYEGDMPRTMSSLSGRPRVYPQGYQYARPLPNQAYTPNQRPRQQYQRPPPIDTQFQGMPVNMYQRPPPIDTRSQPFKKLPPLEPLSPLPNPHQIGEDGILSSPISYAPPRRAYGAGSSVGSPGGSPTTPQQQWNQPMRSLPTPYQLRNSASFTTLDFLPSKKYSPGPGAIADEYDGERYGQSPVISQIPRSLVPSVGGAAEDLRPNWGMRD